MSAQERVLRIKAQLLRERLRIEAERSGGAALDPGPNVAAARGRHNGPRSTPAPSSSTATSSTSSCSGDASSSRSPSDRRWSSPLGLKSSSDESGDDSDDRERRTALHGHESRGQSRRRSKSRPRAKARREKKPKRRRSRPVQQPSASVAPERTSRQLIVTQVRNQMRAQQEAMLEVLNGLDTQLQTQLELKERQNFERRLEERIAAQNKVLLDAIAQRLPSTSMPALDPGPQGGHSRSHTSSFHSSERSFARTVMDHLSPVAQDSRAHDVEDRGPGEQRRETAVPPEPTRSQVLPAPEPEHPGASMAAAEDKEAASIWDKLLDGDADLLEISDDDADKLEEEKEERDAAAIAVEERKRKALKVVVYGSGRPMYRWRKEGVETPPPDQILRGKPLFRAIAGVYVALARMKRDAIVRRTALSNDDRKEMEKAVLWFGDTIRAWMAQVLALSLADIVGKKDLNLDPSAGKGAFGTSIGGGFWRSKPKPKVAGPDKESGLSDAELATLRLKVRVRGVFEALLRSLEDDKPPLPRPIASFLSKLAVDGTVFPDAFLFLVEEEGLDLGPSGYTRWMFPPVAAAATTSAPKFSGPSADESKDEEQKPLDEVPKHEMARPKLMICTFVIIRCLLPVLCRPWELGVTKKPDKRSQNNLCAVATVAYVLMRAAVGGPEQGLAAENYRKPQAGETPVVSRLARRDSLRLGRRNSAASIVAEVSGSGENAVPKAGNAKPRQGWMSRLKAAPNKVAPVSEVPVSAAHSGPLGSARDASSVAPQQQDLEGGKSETPAPDGENADSDEAVDPMRYAGLEHYLVDLLQDKQLASLLQHESFMAELRLVFDRCLLRLLQKALLSAETALVPKGVLVEVDRELARLGDQEHSLGARSVLRRRNEELMARKQRQAEKAALERRLAEQAQIDEATKNADNGDQGPGGEDDAGDDEDGEAADDPEDGDEDDEEDEDEDGDEEEILTGDEDFENESDDGPQPGQEDFDDDDDDDDEIDDDDENEDEEVNEDDGSPRER